MNNKLCRKLRISEVFFAGFIGVENYCKLADHFTKKFNENYIPIKKKIQMVFNSNKPQEEDKQNKVNAAKWEYVKTRRYITLPYNYNQTKED